MQTERLGFLQIEAGGSTCNWRETIRLCTGNVSKYRLRLPFALGMPFIGIIHHKDMVGKKMYDEYIGYDVVLLIPLWLVFRTHGHWY